MKLSLSVEIFDSLQDLMRLFRSRMRQSLETVHPELTFNEARILLRTGLQPGVTQKDLVEHSRIDKAQMARILAHLQEKGWLQRSPSATDKRVRCLSLSAAGTQLFTQLRALQEQIATELLQGCAQETQAELHALLLQTRDSANQAAEA
ncbi:MAG: MarR family transcriptional regulator [Alcaligenaceae bacterium]|nr:MarR family transcriptional regulator [Alcaligenaceae bacterium]